jgi:urease accessory protein
VTRMVHAAPVGWRPTPDAVYVVGTSAAPVGDDQVSMNVEVEAGAALTIRSTAATVIWSGQGTCHTTDVHVASGARLDWRPEPVVATAGCRHRHLVTVALEGTAQLRWREVLILGRHGETTGSVYSSLSVDLDGAPLLRHSLSVGPAAGPGWDGPAVLGSARAVGLQLVAGVTQPASRPAAGPGWAVLPLDGPAVLMLATASTSTAVEAALAAAAAN